MEWSRRAFETLLRSVGRTRFPVNGEDAWVVVPQDCGEARRPLILRAMPVDDTHNEGPHTVVILVDLDATPKPTCEVLQKVFELTPAEARLAVEIACGKSPEEIAEATHVAVGTVRKQLGSVFGKTNTHRQGELAALMARVSILP